MPRLGFLSAAVLIPALLPTLLAGCSGSNSGGSSDSSADLVEAFGLVGQADFIGGQSNRGDTVSALGIAQPLGGIATDGQHFYLADYGNHRVLGWNAIPADPATPPDFVLGQDSFTAAAPGTAANRLALPSSVAIADGKLIVADAGNNRVLIWNTLPGANVAANIVVGQSDFTSDDPGLSASALSFPAAAAAANGKLFVADQNNNRVLIWNQIPSVSGTAADVVLGQAEFTTSEPADEDDGLNNPAALWTDGFRLLVGDSGNNRVMYWAQIPRDSGSDATYAIGQTDFSRSTAGVSSAALRTPYGIASDGTRIYIADAGNNRVLKFDAFPIASGAVALDVYGQDDFTSRAPNDDDQDGVADDEPSAGTLSSPTGVTYASGVLYVSDRNNHRVLFFPD